MTQHPVIRLELQPLELEALRQVLRSYLDDLRTEISHTDTRDFRESLKSQQAMLEKLLRQIEQVADAAST